MDSTTPPQSSRPITVTLAVILIAVSQAIGFLQVFADAPHVQKPAVYIFVAAIVITPYVVLWFIFRGKNWARRVFLVVVGSSACALPSSVQRLQAMETLDIVLFSSRFVMAFVAALLLLWPTSVEWFKKTQK